jgi:hypothetical protein
MFAAVSFGKISAERPVFYLFNAIGSILILVGASTQFDMGDAGAIGQELIWAGISLAGGFRAWAKAGGLVKAGLWINRVSCRFSARSAQAASI